MKIKKRVDFVLIYDFLQRIWNFTVVNEHKLEFFIKFLEKFSIF